MSKVSYIIRTMVLVVMVVVLSFMCGLKLMQTQIVDGGKYLELTKTTYTAEQDVEATRGMIVDSSGKILNTSRIVYSVNFQYSQLKEGTENDIIYRVLKVLIKNGEKWNESLPISKTQPYGFMGGKDSAVEKLKKTLKIADYSSAEDCMYWLYKTYDIGDKYDEDMRRLIAGVRYEMTIKDFSNRNKFVLVSGISDDTIHELKELSLMLGGVDITESWERVYLDGELSAHYRGTVKAISAEQYDELKKEGYTLNDVIGESGVELALESTLRGTRGVRTITYGSDGMMISDEITKDPVSGNSVMLTIDTQFQQLVQDALNYHIQWLKGDYCRRYATAYLGSNYLREDCEAGAVVVLDVKTGGVLAMASYPNYDINDYVADYYEVMSRDHSPVFNRALNGTYRPGSTFKTITSAAGLMEGKITTSSTIFCGHDYTYYAPGFVPTCLGSHANIDVRDALMYSCNIFYYETARRLGIDTLAAWAARFGIGTDLGFELKMETGQMSSLELYEQKGLEWHAGDIVQAGIGQCETLVTPLHLAVQAMTLANKGVRYTPHIVKSVYNYDFSQKLYDKEAVVADDISVLPNMTEYMNAIRDGMKRVANRDGYYPIPNKGYVNVYDYVGVGVENVAIKTGSPQVAENVFNGAIVGFYPAENPEIAIGILLEEGELAKYMVANIIKAYVSGTISTNCDENGVPISPV
ncbi:MAG: hypothetical protein J1F03_01185 [Oscillospiraceae bacterium]|nr:hypothetical protein [Oscillospiraceae bacterium]